MDSRTNDVEDFQSTPEHPPNRVGGPGASKAVEDDVAATPGALRQAILDAEHEAHAADSRATSGRDRSARPAGERAGLVSERALAWAALGVAVAVAAVAFKQSRFSAR
jgi:hypothetical protein